MVYIFQATTVIGHILIVVWIYLVVVVRKKKTKIFRDQMEPKLAERSLKWLKTSLLVAGISFVVFVIATIGGLVVFLKGRRKQDKGIQE